MSSDEAKRDYQKQYKMDNKAKIKKSNALYYRKNRLHLLKHQDVYRNAHRTERKAYAAEHYLKNKTSIRALRSEYYQKNIQDISIRKGKKVTCSCGRVVSSSGLSAHMKRLIHIETVNQPYEINKFIFKN